MAQNVTIAKSSYINVPAIDVPKTGGGTATFVDTSDATATASDIRSGKKAYVNGSLVNGSIIDRSSSSLTVEGATVIVPAGMYSTEARKAVSTASHSAPSVSINSSTGLITASHTQTFSGWVSVGTTTKTMQLTTQSATTITPTSGTQTAVESGVYTTGAVTVAAVPTETKTVTTNGTVTPTSGKFLSSVTVAIPVYDGSVT